MGYYRFRLSDMMPNAWFYKLKEMGKTKTHTNIPTDKKQATNASQPHKSYHNSHCHLLRSHRRCSSYPRKSYYFTRDLVPNNHNSHLSPTNSKPADIRFPDPPRISSKRKPRKTKPPTARYSSDPNLVSANGSCRATATTLWTKSSDSRPDHLASSSDSTPDRSSEFCEADSFPPEFRSDRNLATDSNDKMFVSDGIDDHDIIIDVDKKSLGARFDKLDISDLDLPPIITKPKKFGESCNNADKDSKEKEITKETAKHRISNASLKVREKNSHASILSVKTMKEDKTFSSVKKRQSLNSPGLRLRVNSPRIAASRKIQGGRKSLTSTSSSSSRSLSDSLAVVKSSFDPQKDFKESMVEMIMENNIRESKDLEDLLACYLLLNSDEYHDLIIEVFKQIWLDMTVTPSK